MPFFGLPTPSTLITRASNRLQFTLSSPIANSIASKCASTPFPSFPCATRTKRYLSTLHPSGRTVQRSKPCSSHGRRTRARPFDNHCDLALGSILSSSSNKPLPMTLHHRRPQQAQLPQRVWERVAPAGRLQSRDPVSWLRNSETHRLDRWSTLYEQCSLWH